MTLKNLEWERELNWLVRSKKTAARVGDWCACWGASINFLIASCIALTTMSPIRNAAGIIIGEEVGCKFLLETFGGVSGNESLYGCGDAKWAEFGVVVGVFVEAEMVDISVVALDHVR